MAIAATESLGGRTRVPPSTSGPCSFRRFNERKPQPVHLVRQRLNQLHGAAVLLLCEGFRQHRSDRALPLPLLKHSELVPEFEQVDRERRSSKRFPPRVSRLSSVRFIHDAAIFDASINQIRSQSQYRNFTPMSLYKHFIYPVSVPL